MTSCPTCNEELPAGTTVCPKDGTPIAAQQRPTGTILRSTPMPPKRPGPRASTPSPIKPNSLAANIARASSSSASIGGARASAELSVFIDATVEISPGAMIGEYEVTEKIGEGGMGEVYSAIHPIIGKKVAIKVLAESVASNKEVIRRFVAEARAVNQIGHRNIVDVFSFGQLNDGRQYFVMELLDGRSLEDELEERVVIPVEELVELSVQVLDALQAAHDCGIIHRDLKPDNIFVCDGRRREPKLLDFGIAKLTGDDQERSKTRTGMAMGTPDYMSPEQCRGAGVDHRTDIYAMGVILYRALTGRFPFDGSNPMDLFFKHMHEEPTAPGDLVVMGEAFQAIILRCMQKEPTDRFASAGELAEALVDALKTPGESTRVKTAGQAAQEPPANTGAVSSTSEALPRVAAATAQPGTLSVEPARQANEEKAAPRSEAPSTSKRNLILGVAVAVAGAGVVTMILLGQKSKPSQVAAHTPTQMADAGAMVAVAEIDAAPPRAVDAAPAKPAAKPGTLHVKTNLKGAEVKLDHKLIGSGFSVKMANIVAGDYIVEVSAPEYESQSYPVTVAAGKVETIAVVLKKARSGSGKKTDGKKTGNKVAGDKKPEDKKPGIDQDGTIGDVFDRPSSK